MPTATVHGAVPRTSGAAAQRPSGAARSGDGAAGATGTSRAARYFFWLEIPWAKLVVFRFAFFALLSIDAFLQLPHASRYGANNFNVPHFSWLPLPEPGRAGITFAHAAMCILFALVAQGALVRVALPIATVLYGWAYFSSQLDSYQHHYLVWLLLVILCFAPRAPDPLPRSASPNAPRTTTSWALRLALVQVSIVYLWAAIAKMDTLWVDGTALFIQVRDGWVRNTVASIGFSRMAVFIIAGELFLAVAMWNRKLWLFALPVGIGLHVGIELVGLEIGLFSYLMFAVYLLVVPDMVYARAAAAYRHLGAPHLRGQQLPTALRYAAWPAAIVAVLATAYVVPLPLGAALVVTYAVMAVAAAISHFTGEHARSPRVGWALAVAALVPLAVHAKTDTADDYYRYWAGSARRLGDDKDARRAYAGLLEVDASSEYAHYYLGKQDAAAGNLDAALAHYQAAQRSAPERGRSFYGEAEIHLRRNKPDAAKAALAAGLAVDPDPQAQSLYQSLGGAAANAPNAPKAPVSPDADQD
ncbi:MAG TPA: HTTM domain-containing protein [Kofleriaceae bacterium]|nr:HTTM domain-containing protein [Kofleriaceae bacterium]